MPGQRPPFIPVHSQQLLGFSSDRIVANLVGPSRVVMRYFSMKACSGMSASLGARSCLITLIFARVFRSRLIIRVHQRIGKKLMTRITHAAQIDLRFGDSACKTFDVSAGMQPRDLTCEILHFFTKRLVRLDGKAQTVAERIFCRAGTALITFRPSANLSIHAIGFNLAVARQAAFFPLAGVASITSNSRSSASCKLRRNVSPRIGRRRSISCRLALRRLSAMVARRSIRSI